MEMKEKERKKPQEKGVLKEKMVSGPPPSLQMQQWHMHDLCRGYETYLKKILSGLCPLDGAGFPNLQNWIAIGLGLE